MAKNVLVFYSFATHKTGYINRLFSVLTQYSDKHNLSLYRGSLKDLQISIKNNKLSIIEPLTNKSVSDFSAVYVELWYKSQQQALALAKYCAQNNIAYFSKELEHILPISKLGEYAVLSDNQLPLIDSLFTSNKQLKELAKENRLPFEFPMILKDIEGYGGNNNYLLKNKQELIKIINENKDITFVLQKFIKNSFDYRVLVFGGEVKLIIQRKGQSDTHLNNTSKGAEGLSIPLNKVPSKIIDDSLLAAKLLGRSEFCGVDTVVETGTNHHYILEVNQTPQIEDGAEVDKKINALLGYIKELANG